MAARQQRKDYDWLSDPFDEGKQQAPSGLTQGSKMAITLGCAGVLVALIAVVVLGATLLFGSWG